MKEPYIAHSGLTGEIYVIVGKDKYNVTEQAKKAVKAVEQPILDKIKAEIAMYEADCRLSDDEYLACEECTDNVFGSIYRIIDKYKAGEEE